MYTRKMVSVVSKVLTVSIAAYNVESYIKETIESLLIPEILDDLEVFIIDDGGKDKTYSIAKEYEEKYPGTFHAVHKENGGWGSTVNYSISNATGKYFRLLDGDDYFDREGLRDLIGLLNSIDTDVVYTSYRRFDDKTRRIVETFSASDNVIRNKTIPVSQTNGKDFVMHSSTFRTKILQDNKIRITEHCFYTDNEYRTKGMAFVQTAYITNLCVYQYRVGREGQSIDITGIKKHYKDNLEVLKELIRFEANLPKTCNISMVNNNIDSVIEYHYNNLIIIGNKSEYKEFDNQMLNLHRDSNVTEKSLLKLARSTNYRFFALISLGLKTRISFARKVKTIVSRVSG